jgi:hypothetical protein
MSKKKKDTFRSEWEAVEYLKARGWVQTRTGEFMHTKIHGYRRAVYKAGKGVWKTKPL